MKPSYGIFVLAVEAAGLKPRTCGNGHWQILGGKYLVNFYPATKKGNVAYVNGTTGATNCNVEQAIAMAKGEESHLSAGEKAKRKGGKSIRSHKRRLLKRDPHCHYCRRELTHENCRLDHRIPLSRGGSNGSDNLVLACETCDTNKRTMLPHEFEATISEPLTMELACAISTY